MLREGVEIFGDGGGFKQGPQSRGLLLFVGYFPAEAVLDNTPIHFED
jgi:hypothetical protein